jgi:hypothetical protein
MGPINKLATMHEPSTFSRQLTEYKAMPKLTKLLHRTLFWIAFVEYYRAEARENYRISEMSVYLARRTEARIVAERYNTTYNFCTARLKQAQRDLMNLLIGIEQINNIVS